MRNNKANTTGRKKPKVCYFSKKKLEVKIKNLLHNQAEVEDS